VSLTREEFPKTYEAIRAMAKKAMLSTEMSRAIVRKSGVRPGVSSPDTPPVEGLGATVLLSTDPGQSVQRSETYLQVPINVIYTSVLYNSGMEVASVPPPYSFEVPITGVYKMSASYGVWRDSWSLADRFVFEASWHFPDNSLDDFVRLSYDWAQPSLTRTAAMPGVYQGATYAYMEAGRLLRFYFNRLGLSGRLVGLEHRPDTRYSRLLLELVLPYPEE
jgi:hypothetical protein